MINQKNKILIVEKEKNVVNFFIATKDESVLKKTLEEITRQIKIQKIEQANVIICNHLPSQR